VLGRTNGAPERVSSWLNGPIRNFEDELDRPWAENVVTAAAAVLTVALVSSVAVLMYLA
jgi:hypothetical protein